MHTAATEATAARAAAMDAAAVHAAAETSRRSRSVQRAVRGDATRSRLACDHAVRGTGAADQPQVTERALLRDYLVVCG